MSQLIKNNTGGGGGGIVGVVAEVGGSTTANPAPVYGQKASTVDTMETYLDDSGNLRVADQTWQTQYVVDPSSTTGLKGTFQTLQAAIDQAVIDAPSGTVNIYLRSTYGMSEEIPVFPENIAFNIFSDVYAKDNNLNRPVGFSNVIDFPSGVNPTVNFVGLKINGISSESSTPILYFENCLIGSLTAVEFGVFNLYNSYLTVASIGGGCFLELSNCVAFNNTITLADSALLYAEFSQLGTIAGTSTVGLNLIHCSAVAINGSFATDEGASNYIDHCNTTSSRINSSYPLIQATGLFYVSNCSGMIYNSTPTIAKYQSDQGNIIVSKAVEGTYTVLPSDYYIGVNSSAACTITLPDPTLSSGQNISKDQAFIIKDESGAANTNNITINVVGSRLIDGSATASINTNYGSLTLKSNGTNYFII